MISIYAVLAPHDSEQNDMLNRVYEDSNLDNLPEYK